MALYGGIEAGGTKFICAVGTGPGALRDETEIPTTTPAETMQRVGEFFCGHRLKGVGIGSFGPVDPAQGVITRYTPKLGWRGFKFRETVERLTGVPAVLDTDVNAAAMGEHRWGAAQDTPDFLYLTVGTGIGGGGMANGRLLHGLVHPEMGHIRVPRHPGDRFSGSCPTHGDCLEGLACGKAMEQRWNAPRVQDLPDGHPAWNLEAYYLACGVVNFVCTVSPTLVILGGGVMKRRGLLSAVRREVRQLLKGYVPCARLSAPKLGGRAGVLGALALAAA
ncbi:MAG: ROK family protein [Acidobacteria bacterium]|nr:ROK family protein [Acidobacteriota bacterium]